MDFYIGGIFQGKLSAAKKNYPEFKVVDGENFEELVLAENQKFIWNDFNLGVKKFLEEGKSFDFIKEKFEKVIEKNPEAVFISCEIGCGIVPLEKSERDYREFVGRLQILAAQKAAKVFRVNSGILVRLK